MPSVLSRDFKRAALASETHDFPIFLLRIWHQGALPEPLLLSSDMTELLGYENGTPKYGTRHGGEAYLAYPFAFTLPDAPGGGDIATARLTIDNVDRRLIPALRELPTSLKVRAKIVMASAPERVEYEVQELLLSSIEYDASQISGQLGIDHYLGAACPALSFLPSVTPGLF